MNHDDGSFISQSLPKGRIANNGLTLGGKVAIVMQAFLSAHT